MNEYRCPIGSEGFAGMRAATKIGEVASDLDGLPLPDELRHLRDELYGSEDAAPPVEGFSTDDDNDDEADAGETGRRPPFAWVDRNDGLDCRRWGVNLGRELLPPGQQEEITPRQYRWMSVPLQRWRWLGFAFFDRARAELLKEHLPEYGTGWLTRPRPPDEECNRTEDDWRVVVETDEEDDPSDQDFDAIEDGEGGGKLRLEYRDVV
ncbi:hypothetical protein PG988_008014 [Apiospora saccharicola]